MGKWEASPKKSLKRVPDVTLEAACVACVPCLTSDEIETYFLGMPVLAPSRRNLCPLSCELPVWQVASRDLEHSDPKRLKSCRLSGNRLQASAPATLERSP